MSMRYTRFASLLTLLLLASVVTSASPATFKANFVVYYSETPVPPGGYGYGWQVVGATVHVSAPEIGTLTGISKQHGFLSFTLPTTVADVTVDAFYVEPDGTYTCMPPTPYHFDGGNSRSSEAYIWVSDCVAPHGR